MGQENGHSVATEQSIIVRFSHDVVSVESLLKACYWFSRDFACEVTEDDAGHSIVSLRPKVPGVSLEGVHDDFMNQALDFALRERVNANTADIRDLLLAKAFSESGVLEDQPQGTFGDPVEEKKPDSMFKILSSY
jgi:His-Xaa-Ser system protein HxsD